MLVLTNERVPIARLLKFMELGEQLAHDCAEAQAQMVSKRSMQVFLRGQARQERAHAVAFQGAILWLAPRHLGSSPFLAPLQRYRELIQGAMVRGDFLETVLAEQIILEGLGEVILNRMEQGLVKRNAPFRTLRRILLQQEEAHHGFGVRTLKRAVEAGGAGAVRGAPDQHCRGPGGTAGGGRTQRGAQGGAGGEGVRRAHVFRLSVLARGRDRGAEGGQRDHSRGLRGPSGLGPERTVAARAAATGDLRRSARSRRCRPGHRAGGRTVQALGAGQSAVTGVAQSAETEAVAVETAAMAEEAKRRFKRRVREWADRLEVEIQGLAVRPMTAKWASCSTNGHLNFNRELLGFGEEVWDYVIVHELLHFEVPNHGRLWKSLMRAHLGSYEEAERMLRSGAAR